ncbi:5'-deoxynucleotidase HDDC2 [Onthophagus taurus]|uniref:5'-deoxynucleotidase HDDC2 n=1 Tax=Onthophagus taurus TaxID=166361 RepID=UPI000C209D5A|nr:HD domain-containing protein 2 [Onthophagus taurus]XP_022911818.1 HD domain-containing protein 2 [Onthophagus taurus]
MDNKSLENESLQNVKSVLKFLNLVHELKYSVRRGWERRGVEGAETISGHMYAMAMMTFLLPNNSNLDRLKCLQLTVIHDLAECIVGDITPHDGIPEEEKHRREDEAMKDICELVGGEQGQLMQELYKEYETKATPEAKFVKDLDRFDFIFTAFDLEKKRNKPREFQDFFDHMEGQFEHPLIQELVKGLNEERNQYGTNSK